MKDYFRNDIVVNIDFDSYKDVFPEHYGEKLLISTYDSRLLYNHRKPEYLQLTIYYPQADYLFEKFQILKDKGICIFHTIKPKSVVNKWEYPDVLDFSGSKLINIEESHYYEHNKKPVVLTIDNLNIRITGKTSGNGRFQLTENIFQHIGEYIQYGELARYRSNDKFIEQDNNREINFGDIRFVLSIEHWFGNSTKLNLDITRDAYLTITDKSEKYTDIELIKFGNNLCLLMSFFWQKNIDFFNGHARINNIDNYGTLNFLKYSSHFVDESTDYVLKQQFDTFYDFVEVINFEQFIEHSSLLKELVPRIIKIKNVDEISAFMILYNIIEKIRNYCMSTPVMGKEFSIKEEFKFTKGKKATDKFIKNKIKEVNEIVDKSDVDGFLDIASNKVNFIKKTGLIEQFDSLLSYLDLTPSDYNIDFTNLIKIRNSIYHGKLPKEDIDPYNRQLIILIYDMIMKSLINK